MGSLCHQGDAGKVDFFPNELSEVKFVKDQEKISSCSNPNYGTSRIDGKNTLQ